MSKYEEKYNVDYSIYILSALFVCFVIVPSPALYCKGRFLKKMIFFVKIQCQCMQYL